MSLGYNTFGFLQTVFNHQQFRCFNLSFYVCRLKLLVNFHSQLAEGICTGNFYLEGNGMGSLPLLVLLVLYLFDPIFVINELILDGGVLYGKRFLFNLSLPL